MSTTWSELRVYLENNYVIAGVSPYGQLVIKFDFPDGRHQMVMVSQATRQSTGEEWVQIESVVAHASDVNLHKLLDYVKHQLIGGLAKNEDYVTVRHSMRLLDMRPAEINVPLYLLVNTADYLESTNGQPDRF